MNILLASHGFPPTHLAGAERRTERMAKWLNTHEHRVVVFTVERIDDPHQRVETREQDGFLVHRLYYDAHSGGVEAFYNIYDNPFVGEALRYVLARDQFDLVHIISGYLLGVPAIEVSKQLGLPVVLTLTEFWFMCARLNLIQSTGALCIGPESIQKCARCLMEDKRRYRLPAQNAPAVMDMLWPIGHFIGFTDEMQDLVYDRQTLLRKALEAVDLVISPSQFLIDKFKEFGFNTIHFVHLRQGLAAPSIPQHHIQPHREADEALHITYVGQIKYHKGVDILLDAVVDLLDSGENVKLDLWGKETESPEYVSRLKNFSMPYAKIRWNGSFSGSQIWDILRKTDVLVMPSRWYENSPNSILEAFAMRVPVVATNLGGMAELVTHEQNGLLFEVDNVKELRSHLQRLVKDAYLLPKLRADAPSIKTLNQEMGEIITHYTHFLHTFIGLFILIGMVL